VVRCCVRSRNLVNEEALAQWGAIAPKKKLLSNWPLSRYTSTLINEKWIEPRFSKEFIKIIRDFSVIPSKFLHNRILDLQCFIRNENLHLGSIYTPK